MEEIIYSNIQAKGDCPPIDSPTFTISCSRATGFTYCCPEGWSCDPEDNICGYGGCCPP